MKNPGRSQTANRNEVSRRKQAHTMRADRRHARRVARAERAQDREVKRMIEVGKNQLLFRPAKPSRFPVALVVVAVATGIIIIGVLIYTMKNWG